MLQCMTFITDLGDSGVLGALVIALSGYLYFAQCKREAIVLLASFIATSLAIALVKVLLMGCGSALRSYGLHSPSGHTALSLSVYGTLAALIGNQLKSHYRFIPAGIMIPLAALIAVSRVVLGYHTIPEVMAGLAIGTLTLLLTVTRLRKVELKAFNPALFLGIMLLIAVPLHGVRLPAESLIQLIAGQFRHFAQCAE